MAKITIETLIKAKKEIEKGSGVPRLMGCTHYFNGAAEHPKLKGNEHQKFCTDCFEQIIAVVPDNFGTREGK